MSGFFKTATLAAAGAGVAYSGYKHFQSTSFFYVAHAEAPKSSSTPVSKAMIPSRASYVTPFTTNTPWRMVKAAHDDAKASAEQYLFYSSQESKGAVYVKWHLPSSSAAEHRGRTDKAPIREHKATWEYSKSLPVRLTIEKNLSLLPCEIHFEILQDYHDGGRGGRVVLGNVKLNLAEYAHVPEALVKGDAQEGEDGRITRRYLMHDSKVNATLKIGIAMKQTDGDTNFIAPPLRSAMVIGGIAGIMSGETGETEDMPSIASKSRELSEAQDIYRRTLAASWACETGELPPDQLIEDIFAGGDGGSKSRLAYAQRRMAVASPPPFHRPRHHHSRPTSRGGGGGGGGGDDESTTSSDADSKRTVTKNGSSTHLTPDMARHGHNHGHRRGANSLDAAASQISAASGVSGRGSIEQQMHLSQPGHHRHGSHHRPGRRKVGERDLTEFDLRDDLRSWQVSVK